MCDRVMSNKQQGTTAVVVQRPLPRAVLKRYRRAFSTRCTGSTTRHSTAGDRGSRDDLALEECVAECPHNTTPLRATPVVLPRHLLVRASQYARRGRAVEWSASAEDRYIAVSFPLGGGLNNMLWQPVIEPGLPTANPPLSQ